MGRFPDDSGKSSRTETIMRLMVTRWRVVLGAVWLVLAGIPGVAAAESETIDGMGGPLPAGFKRNIGLERGALTLAIERGQTKTYRLITMVRVRIEHPLDRGGFQERLEGRYPDTWHRRGAVKQLRVDGIGARDSSVLLTCNKLEWHQPFIYCPVSDGVVYLQLVCPKTAYQAGRDVLNQMLSGIRVDSNLRPPTPLIHLGTLMEDPSKFIEGRVMVTGQFERRVRSMLAAGGRAIELNPPDDAVYKALFEALPYGEPVGVEGIVEVRPEGPRFIVERVASGTLEPVTVGRLSRHLREYSGVQVLIDGTVVKDAQGTFLVGPGKRRVSVDSSDAQGTGSSGAPKIGKRAVLIGVVTRENPGAPIPISRVVQGD